MNIHVFTTVVIISNCNYTYDCAYRSEYSYDFDVENMCVRQNTM